MDSWDVFFSYHPDKLNQQKVIAIRNYLVLNLRITTWFDSIEVTQPGERAKKIFQGISNSKLFLCFVTPEYSDNEQCLNELFLAKRLGKKMIFFVYQEDTTGMNQEQLAKDVFKTVSFYLGDNIYYRNKKELLECFRTSIEPKATKETSIVDRKARVFVSYHDSAKSEAQILIKKLEPLFDATFETKEDERNNETILRLEEIEKCDLFVAIVNSHYKRCDDCNIIFLNAFESQTAILVLNLESDVDSNINSNELITNIELYEDPNKLYLNGIGKEFISIVHNIQTKLPKSFSEIPKAIDLLIISPKSYKSDIVQMKLASKVKFLQPDDNSKPDLVAVKDAKVILVIINDDVNTCEKSIEELRFAQLIGTQIISIEDTDIKQISLKLKDILKSIPSSCQFQGTENLNRNTVFKRQLALEIKNALKRAINENESMAKFLANNDKLFEREKTTKKIDKFKKTIFNLRAVFISFFVLLACAYIVAVIIAAIAFNKDYIEYQTTTRQSSTVTSPGTTKPPVINKCWRENLTSATFPNQGYVPINIESAYFQDSQIYAVIEICIPEPHFVVKLASSLVLINGEGTKINTSTYNFFMMDKNIDMVASDREIFIIDGSDYVYRFNFGLESNGFLIIKQERKESLFSLFYDSLSQSLYVYEINKGFHVFNKVLDKIDFLPLKQDNQFRFQVKDSLIHLVSQSESVYMKYSIKNRSVDDDDKLKWRVCFNDEQYYRTAKDFFIDADNFFYCTCAITLKQRNNDVVETNTALYVYKLGAFEKQYNAFSIPSAASRFLIDPGKRLIFATKSKDKYFLDFYF